MQDKHVVISGGSRGIGAAIADKLDEYGARITLLGRSETALRNKSQCLQQAIAVTVDVTDSESVDNAFSTAERQHGPVAILINNTGAVLSSPVKRLSDADWLQMLNVNLTSTFYCTRRVLPAMIKSNWGRIINIASTAGLKGYPYVAAYCAAKHGVIGLTRSMALEHANTGITVNAVCPGYTRTEFLDDAITNIVDKTGRSREDAEEQLKSANPQHRFINPEEVGTMVAWLCLPGSESITGQALAIAGGEVM